MPRSPSNLKLLKFIYSLDTNGSSSLGPQSLFKCDISDEDHVSLIPSKSLVEVLDIRYSSSNAYVCLLKDFLSSHQNFFGTVWCLYQFSVIRNHCQHILLISTVTHYHTISTFYRELVVFYRTLNFCYQRSLLLRRVEKVS
jgi:hypothetical protein